MVVTPKLQQVSLGGIAVHTLKEGKEERCGKCEHIWAFLTVTSTLFPYLLALFPDCSGLSYGNHLVQQRRAGWA